MNAQAAEYRASRRAELAAKQRARYQENREAIRQQVRAAALLREYGITVEQYDALFEAQGGSCALCRRPSGKHHLAVDHDHQTGRVRGLLCSRCNGALGTLGDDVAGLQRAIRYLQADLAIL